MLRSQNIVPFSQIVSVLTGLCQKGQTGKLYLVTDKKHIVNIDVDQGEICSMRYRIHKGLRALDHLKKIKAATYRFEPDQELSLDSDLPPTLSLIQDLGGNVYASNKAPETSELTTQFGNTSIASIAPEIVQEVEAVLSATIGPMAKLVCNKVANIAIDRQDFIRLAAEKIPDEAMRREFLNNIGG